MRGAPKAPEMWQGSQEEHSRKIAQVVNGVLRGRLNNTFEVTLTVDATSTLVTVPFARPGMVAQLTPMSLSAAGEQLTTWAEAANGSVTVHHASNGTAGRTFALVVWG